MVRWCLDRRHECRAGRLDWFASSHIAICCITVLRPSDAAVPPPEAVSFNDEREVGVKRRDVAGASGQPRARYIIPAGTPIGLKMISSATFFWSALSAA